VVVGASGELHGWLAREHTSAPGRVADQSRRMEAWVPRHASLKTALSEMLQHDAGWVAVLDGDRFLGVLTPSSLHLALRRSVDADVAGARAEDVVPETAGEPLRA
jgi:osmoprotectant transport system ATP-binding protein